MASAGSMSLAAVVSTMMLAMLCGWGVRDTAASKFMRVPPENYTALDAYVAAPDSNYNWTDLVCVQCVLDVRRPRDGRGHMSFAS